jgi:hypothetical protein
MLENAMPSPPVAPERKKEEKQKKETLTVSLLRD